MTNKLNGGYLGGSTVVSNRDKSWFSKKSMAVPPETAGARPPRSGYEQRAFDEFAASSLTSQVLKPSDVEYLKMMPRQKAKERRRRERLPV